MAIRAKARRSTPRRRTVAVKASKTPVKKRAVRPGLSESRKNRLIQELKPQSNGLGTFNRAVRYLAGLSDYERLRIVRYTSQNFDLERMRSLLKKIGNPHQQFKSVHVAGTKGKGSTCAMVAAMLQACGYKVGLYTSPHLVDVRERIQINGEMIPAAEFARLVRTLEPIVTKARPTPSYFDVLTAIAFKYFADEKVDIAIVETGLGGRLDSTNVIKPEITAITSISKDHMAQLGNTLSKIAAEKAGIFKHGVPALSVVQDPEAEPVLKEVAAKVGAPLDIVGKSIEFSYRFESSRMLGPHNRICLTTANSRFEHLAVPLVGEHQAINCGLALSIIDKLKNRGFNITDAKAMEGLAKVTIPGRMEQISQVPRVVVDGAHNAASVDAFLRSVGQHMQYDSMVLIFGCCSDKDVPGMLEKITYGADKVIFTKVDNVRSSVPAELAARYTEMYGKMAQTADTLEDALAIAARAVTKEDMICITGSFYLVGEAKKYFTAKQAAAEALAKQS
jgi:dihydrofolate synthase / folylpolyglutamate synthase